MKLSHQKKQDISSTDKVIKIIDKVIKYTSTKGTCTFDRMGDHNEIIKHCTSEKLQLVTHLKLNRWLCMLNQNGGEIQVQTERMDRHIQFNYKAQITKIEDGKETIINSSFGITKVTLPDKPDIWYNAVVIKCFGELPMISLTNKEVNIYDAKSVYRIVEIYSQDGSAMSVIAI